MNQRDSNPRNQQPGRPQDDGRWDMPRQAGQWQDGPSRQAGGFRDPNEDPRSMERRPEIEGQYSPDSRSMAPDGSLSDPRASSGWGTGDRPMRESAYPIHSFDGASGSSFSNFTSEDYGGHDLYPRHGAISGGMHPSNSYRPTFSFSHDEYGHWRDYGERRGFLKRAGDEIASWFGDESAAHRREKDHRGRGPSDYTRSDERIREDINDSLTNDWHIDATHIRVAVADGEVTLDGTVGSRAEKRRAEDLADDVSGVGHVQNNLRVGPVTATGEE
ncbi:BON domain-containing protein [Novosphingobium sp. BL-8A]|uniref:BON domain-containing protein n=1 Tax=Novosphingobium sp. BL-8A TaxID=3127639 RepID=UPI003756E5D4